VSRSGHAAVTRPVLHWGRLIPSAAGEEVTTMRKDLTIAELESEHVELLPTRETLFFFGKSNWAAVYASNSSLAFNAASINAVAASTANQAILVNQG
jgi:hypothetical protein